MFVVGGLRRGERRPADQRATRQDRKAAYAAAESGVHFYQFHLNADNDYWLKCDDVADPERDRAQPGQPELERAGRRTRGAGATSPAPTRSTRSSSCRRRARRSASDNQAESMIDPGNGHVPDPRDRPSERDVEDAPHDQRDVPPRPASSTTCTSRTARRWTRWRTPRPSSAPRPISNCKKSRSRRPSSLRRDPVPELRQPATARSTRTTTRHGLRHADVRPQRRRQARGCGHGGRRGWVQNGGCSGSRRSSGPFRIGAPDADDAADEQLAQGGRPERRAAAHGARRRSSSWRAAA